MDVDFNELVRAARSCRRFREEVALPESELLELVDGARICPCGGNRQVLRYRVVHARDERERLFPTIQWAGALPNWRGPAKGERPTGYIVIAVAVDTAVGHDLGIAVQTIQLGAAARGWAACMLGAINRTGVSEALGLPETLAVQLVIALGLPAETIVIEPGQADALAYWRDDESVHHVPKLSLDDVLIPAGGEGASHG